MGQWHPSKHSLRYFKFKILGVPIGIRIGCKDQGYATAELASVDRGLNQEPQECGFCGRWHLREHKFTKRERVIMRQDGHCLDCQKKLWWELTIHHVQPKSECGSSELTNLVALCRDCHDKQHGSFRVKSAGSSELSKKSKRTIVKSSKAISKAEPYLTNEEIKQRILTKWSLDRGGFGEKLQKALADTEN